MLRAGRASRLRLTKYGIEAGCLALFMLLLSLAGIACEHPASPMVTYLSPLARRIAMAIIAGTGLVGLAYSPWGKISGAHINPAVTLAYLHLKQIDLTTALCYIGAQLLGAFSGMLIAATLAGKYLAHPSVDFIATAPAHGNAWTAFGAELALSYALMMLILVTSGSREWSGRTGVCVGLFVTVFVVFEGPVSGMSLNPARSLGAAIFARDIKSIWVYLTAPPVGMLFAAETYRLLGLAVAHYAAHQERSRRRAIERGKEA